jgi:hypothetical protein
MVGNHSRIVTVVADPRTAAGDLPSLLAEVSKQMDVTRQARPQSPSAGGLGIAPPWCPVVLKRLAIRLGLLLVGGLICDTCMLTNLGVVTDPPWSQSRGRVRMAFSGPAHMPRGVSVAVVTAAAQTQLCVRYRYALLDDPAAARFTALFAATLEEFR